MISWSPPADEHTLGFPSDTRQVTPPAVEPAVSLGTPGPVVLAVLPHAGRPAYLESGFLGGFLADDFPVSQGLSSLHSTLVLKLGKTMEIRPYVVCSSEVNHFSWETFTVKNDAPSQTKNMYDNGFAITF